MTVLPIDYPMIYRSFEQRAASHDPHRQVGVSIYSPDGELLAVGTNKVPDALHLSADEIQSLLGRDRNWKYFMLEHAERQAIFDALNKGVSLYNASLFSTLFPCADCARAIVAAGIRRVVTPRPGLNSSRDERWLEHYNYAQQIFSAAGTVLDFFDPEETLSK